MRIREQREAAGLTQYAFAKAMGVSCPTVHAWENGTKLPRADKLPKMATILNCTIAALFSSGDNTIVPETEG